MTFKPKGFIFPEAISPATGKPIQAALVPSNNRKTGTSWHLWIVAKDSHPAEALNNGDDRSVCGDCALRPRRDIPNTPSARKEGNYLRSCYVIAPAIGKVWTQINKGAYEAPDPRRITNTLQGQFFRGGAYGDPAMLPFELCNMLAKKAKKHSMYTHQHNQSWYDQRFDRIAMRSIELVSQIRECREAGARYARVDIEGVGVQPGEVLCPAQDQRYKYKNQGQGIQCNDCGLCNGTEGNSKVNVMFIPHGTAGRKMLKLLPVLKEKEGLKVN